MNKSTILTAAICAALALTGCTKDNAASSGSIRCNVRHSSLTKAVEVDIDSLEKSGFTMLGIIDEDAKDYDNNTDYSAGIYINNAKVEHKPTWSIAGDPYWVENVTMRFWCYTPASGLEINPAKGSLIGTNELPFTYTTPASGGSDILFSYNSCKKTGTYSKTIDFCFYHPLTNIRFCVKPTTGAQTSETYKAAYEIVSIALQNVGSIANCTMTGNPYTTPAVAPSFDWSNPSSTATYTQTYNAKFLDGSNNMQCPTTGWTSKVSNGETFYTADEGFFIIPQAIGDDTSLAVTFTRGNTTITRSEKLKYVGPDNWEPGKYYTYCLSLKDTTIVTLLESMEITDPQTW